ncbi:putative ribonuclease H-like domain-containing protein [Tanacetum coccineum]
MVPNAVLMRSGLVSLTTARPVNTAQPRTIVNRQSIARFAGERSNPKEGKSQANVQLKLLTDESHVLLKVPRKNNMYSVDLKNIVPKGGLTCLFAKATSDESKLWHRRLGHINFKTMNKLVKGNLVRGLPSKLFENNQTCVACQKGKQHRASFVIDDYSRFSWVFFLATKDETSGILKSFITGVENLIDQRVKNGIGVNAGDSKLMLLGINLLLLGIVNAARHKLTAAGEILQTRSLNHNQQQYITVLRILLILTHFLIIFAVSPVEIHSINSSADEEGGTTVVGCDQNDASIRKEMQKRKTVKSVGSKRTTRSIRKDSSSQDSLSKENVSVTTMDAAFIPDVGSNGCTTVLDAVGGFVAWPKNQVVFYPKATPPSTIQMITVENKTAPKVPTKRKNFYVSSDAMQKEANKKRSQKALVY